MINVDGTPIHGTIVVFNRVKLSLFIIFITRDVKNIFQNVCRFEQDFKKRFVKILDIRLNWGKSSVVFSFFSLVNIQFGKKKKKIHIYFKFYSSRILSLPGGKGRILEYVWTEKSLEQQRISVKEDLRWGEPLSIQLKDHWFKKIWLKEKKNCEFLRNIWRGSEKKICGKKSFFTKDLDVQSLWSCNII